MVFNVTFVLFNASLQNEIINFFRLTPNLNLEFRIGLEL